jgi:iron complex transport system ATP-binding protein
MSGQAPLVELHGVSCGYDGVDVVHDVSLHIHSGENLCLIGPNGCGKTTLLRAICGLLPLSAGTVRLGGQDIRRLKQRDIAREVAMLSQLSTVHFAYSVYETVMLGRYARVKRGLFDAPGRADRAMVLSCLEAVGMADLAERPIDSLSGGQLQRVFLARTLAQEPALILLDEPTNHLDLRHQVELVDHLLQWSSRENRGVLGVLHDIGLAAKLANRLVLMQAGRIVADGPAKGILASRQLDGVYGLDVRAHMRDVLSLWTEDPSRDEGGEW